MPMGMFWLWMGCSMAVGMTFGGAMMYHLMVPRF
jgi:hypothetical protein